VHGHLLLGNKPENTWLQGAAKATEASEFTSVVVSVVAVSSVASASGISVVGASLVAAAPRVGPSFPIVAPSGLEA
jgi:hypothetical protein